MRRTIYLIAVSAMLWSCGDSKENNNNDVGSTDVGHDINNDMNDVDMGAEDVTDMCTPLVPDIVDPETCDADVVCETIDDNCGGMVERCACECPDSTVCGIDDLGMCSAGACEYSFDGFEELLSEAKVIYVSQGSAAGTGMKDSPFGTISEAVQTAAEGDVLLIRGDFKEQIEMKNGVHLIGGWNQSWELDSSKRVGLNPETMDVSKPSAVLSAVDIAVRTNVFNLDLNGVDATNGGSSYGLFSSNSKLAIRSVLSKGGVGGDGTAGMDGGKGTDGTPGFSVSFSQLQGTAIREPGPIAENADCPLKTKGGKGGQGDIQTHTGNDPSPDATNGEAGSVGVPGVGAGEGGDRATNVLNAQNGGHSLFAAPEGAPGAPATGGGDAEITGWVPNSDGQTGATGEDGRGGGGGGGNIRDSVLYTGAAGGGGGSGGCGGKGGAAGMSGGGSFGLYTINSDLIVEGSTFSASRGGLGGNGGNGGVKGDGGAGGTGSKLQCYVFSGGCSPPVDGTPGPSGDGGAGSAGGNGGNGGAGSGGVSYGAYCSGTTATFSNTSFEKGGQALGGSPNGIVGFAEDSLGCE